MSDQCETGGDNASRPTPGGPAHARTLAMLVKGKNIEETTLLATDYLNHFNDIIMFLEMIPGIPEMLDDAKAWQPKSYIEHFQDSVFADKELAIFAYENAPPRYRGPFDSAVMTMNFLVAEGIGKIEAAIATGNDGLIADTVASVAGNLRKFVDVASAIIHGDERAMDQAEIDAILNG